MTDISVKDITAAACVFDRLQCNGIYYKPAVPTLVGIYLGMKGPDDGGIEICANFRQFIDFTTPSQNFKGRMIYEHFNVTSQGEFRWYINGSGTTKMTLNTTGLTVNGSVTPSSDSRLKFNSTSLTNGLTVINKLAPLEYDQIYELVEQYSPDVPQSHQYGFIAQSVEHIDELRHAVVGG
ncbi:MAG: tail fiber domain-containing protein, partial [Candidatus Fonsibacter sp.]